MTQLQYVTDVGSIRVEGRVIPSILIKPYVDGLHHIQAIIDLFQFDFIFGRPPASVFFGKGFLQ